MSCPFDFSYLDKITDEELKHQVCLDSINMLNPNESISLIINTLEDITGTAVVFCHGSEYSLGIKVFD